MSCTVCVRVWMERKLGSYVSHTGVAGIYLKCVPLSEWVMSLNFCFSIFQEGFSKLMVFNFLRELLFNTSKNLAISSAIQKNILECVNNFYSGLALCIIWIDNYVLHIILCKFIIFISSNFECNPVGYFLLFKDDEIITIYMNIVYSSCPCHLCLRSVKN